MSGRIGGYIRQHHLALLCLFLIVGGGTAYATHPGGLNTISSEDIIGGQVKQPDIGASAVNGPRILNQSVQNEDLAPGSILGSKIADDSLTGADVDEASLGFGGVYTSDFAPPVDVTADAPNFTTVASVAVPPGKWLVQAQANVFAQDAVGQSGEVQCSIAKGETDPPTGLANGGPMRAATQGLNPGEQAVEVVSWTTADTATTSPATTYRLVCRNFNPDAPDGHVENAGMTALEVSAVNDSLDP